MSHAAFLCCFLCASLFYKSLFYKWVIRVTDGIEEASLSGTREHTKHDLFLAVITRAGINFYSLFFSGSILSAVIIKTSKFFVPFSGGGGEGGVANLITVKPVYNGHPWDLAK